jgi:quercetin dioxygenase-like cupin family protein
MRLDLGQCMAAGVGLCWATMSQHTLLASDQPQCLILSDAAETSSAGIVSRTVVQTDELRVVLFAFADGQELTAHSNRRRALVQILGGTCEFQFGGTWHALAAGALLHLPPGHVHAVRASSGPFSMLLTLGAETQNPPAK